ncbi:MAG: hypothetical protein PHG98_06635 [Bacteroidales bacterium]|nr:hypothetical protein [Bacteroidales bacterium]
MKKIFFLLLLSSCNVYSFYSNTIKFDTIKPIITQSYKYDTCYTIITQYYNLNGILISKYYDVMDSIKIDLNNDKQDDYLVVLSPFCLDGLPFIDGRPDCCDFIDTMPKRLLVEIIIENGQSKLRNIYPDIIPSEPLLLKSYNSIEKTKEGFDIIISKGHKYHIDYVMSFIVKDDRILLDKTKKSCFIGDHDKSGTEKYSNLEINKIKIQNILDNNCYCNEYWDYLEKKYKR